jgi:hypothetical protein
MKDYKDFTPRNIITYAFWAMGVLMWEWLRAMFGRECQDCKRRKPLFTHWCDDCWNTYHNY